MPTQRTHLRDPQPAVLRHACTGCGGCCQGVRVPLYNDAERELAARAGRALGVPNPVDGPALRMQAGRCVFLADDNRCRIHAELGPEHKPIPCRQFPLIAIKANDSVRIGVDPASYGAWRSWVDGPPLPEGPIVASSPSAPGGQDQAEAALVALCERPGVTVGDLLTTLTREPSVGGAPPHGFAQRWAQRVHEVGIHGFVAHESLGPSLRAGLAPIAEAARGWADAAPPWPSALAEPERAWAIEAVRRVLYLRLLPQIPSVSVAALLLLGGVVAAAWTDPRPERFHPALTAWIRALRFDLFWTMVAGDRDTLLWLGTGRRPPSSDVPESPASPIARETDR